MKSVPKTGLFVVACAMVLTALLISGCPKPPETIPTEPTSGLENAVTGPTPSVTEGENMVAPTPTPSAGEAPAASGEPGAKPAQGGAGTRGEDAGAGRGAGGRAGGGFGAPIKTGNAELDKVLAKRSTLKSYKSTTVVDGKTVATTMIQLKDGRPVRTKTSREDGGWFMMISDQNVRYMYNPKEKVITKSTGRMGGNGGGPGQGQRPQGERPQGERPQGERPQGARPQGQGGPGGAGGRPGGMGGGMMGMPNLRDLEGSKFTVKSDKLDGVSCMRIDLTTKEGKAVVFWVDTQYGLLRQTKEGDRVVKTKYEMINSVPDSAFALPQGVKVVDAPQRSREGGAGGAGGGAPR